MSSAYQHLGDEAYEVDANHDEGEASEEDVTAAPLLLSRNGDLQPVGRSGSNPDAVEASMREEGDAVQEDEATTELQDKPLVHAAPKLHQASAPSSVFNLCNTVLGAGMLSIPLAFARTGIIFGSLLMLLAASGSIFGLMLLVECAKRTQESSTSYFVVAKYTYPKAMYVIDFAVGIKCFGVATSYLVAVGDFMPPVVIHFFNVDASSVLASRRLWIGLLFLIMLPLSYLKRLNSLRYTSFVALLTVVYVTLLSVVYFFLLDGTAPGHLSDMVYFKLDVQFLQALPTVVFAFTCHQNIFSIYSELRDPTDRRIKGVVYSSLLSSLSVYMIIGIFGYLTFTSTVTGNIISDYPAGAPAANIARLGMVILVVFSYPLQTHPCRCCTDNLLFHRRNKAGTEPSRFRRYTETTCICLCTLLIGLFVENIEVVFQFVGATGSTILCYLLPGLFYVKMESDAPWRGKKLMAGAMVVIGVLIMVLANTGNIIGIVNGTHLTPIANATVV